MGEPAPTLPGHSPVLALLGGRGGRVPQMSTNVLLGHLAMVTELAPTQ